MKKLTELILKYKELITYVFFGALTTAVNFVTFWLFSKLLGEALYYVSNAIAWFVSVVFAYITNKLFVFESKNFEGKTLLKEISVFFSARVFSFFVEEWGLILFVWIFEIGKYTLNLFGLEINGQYIAKALLAVIVVLINYFVSKFAVFRKKGG